MLRRLRNQLTIDHAVRAAGLLGLALVLGLAFGLAGCSADSPSAPAKDPGDPPGQAPSDATYDITITLTPGEIPAGSDEPVQVEIRVRRREDNQPPPTGTTIVVSATAGSFGSPGGPSSTPVETVDGRVVASYFPPAEGAGQVTIQARLEDSIAQKDLQILEPATFFLASVEPDTGSPAGGEPVTIRGGGFEEPVRVTFDGVPAQVQSVTSNRIRVVTPPSNDPPPAGQTQPVPVEVTVNLNEEEEATDTLTDAFIYARGGTVVQPEIFSVSPASGPNEGGTRVTINGEGFQSPVQVFFGEGSSATDFQGVEASVESVSADRIVVTTPPATGFGHNNLDSVVDILVKNLDSGFATVAPSVFQYGAGDGPGGEVPFISAISPGQGPFTGGTEVTLFGQGFDEPVAVELAGVGQSILSVTGTEVVVSTVPVDVTSCNDVSGPSEITNIETGESATGPTFTYRVPEPLVTGVSPSDGPEGGNTLVTITGQNFSEPLRVLFGGQAASVQSVSPTEIQARTPTFAGELETEECGDGGERFVATAVDVTVENLQTTCNDTFPSGFNYNPSDSTCRNEEEPEPEETECTDGFDNDGDGLIDEEDPDCTGPDDDDESS
ncbi:MAG: IPT/TIG domain-containing protein [Thermoanaerobaculia bacterium]